MKIETQLQEWAKTPTRDNDKSSSTYATIKKVLESRFGDDVDIFLQGSYANSTNIKKDSDVDIVLRHKNVYFSDISALSESEKFIYNSSTVSATYSFDQFKKDVAECLEGAYPSHVERKNKCIKIHKKISNRVNVDVVPCFSHKRYSDHKTVIAEGIEFIKDEKNDRVKSFPKQHKENGENKNTESNQNYKAVVRILKNIKRELVENNELDEKLINSFMIEALCWNVNKQYYIGETWIEVVNKVMCKIYEDMENVEAHSKYAEISDLFYLLHLERTEIKIADIKVFLEAAYKTINK